MTEKKKVEAATETTAAPAQTVPTFPELVIPKFEDYVQRRDVEDVNSRDQYSFWYYSINKDAKSGKAYFSVGSKKIPDSEIMAPKSLDVIFLYESPLTGYKCSTRLEDDKVEAFCYSPDTQRRGKIGELCASCSVRKKLKPDGTKPLKSPLYKQLYMLVILPGTKDVVLIRSSRKLDEVDAIAKTHKPAFRAKLNALCGVDTASRGICTITPDTKMPPNGKYTVGCIGTVSVAGLLTDEQYVAVKALYNQLIDYDKEYADNLNEGFNKVAAAKAAAMNAASDEATRRIAAERLAQAEAALATTEGEHAAVDAGLTDDDQPF